ncbi:hypothetical protein [Streptomyces thermoviolaceus]|uniref:hypothetical protein n=1 Tax=Streptomyces thermoviolaceus TaxID=1952 RepID=UPI00167AD15E|nr:hypothetical protein [Streptomyces thermoviolaceus]GGV80509.1 hypothetical protein GCM10010499_43600 [Streptomyces thermoviolaceus subsp. apingens]
MYIPFRPGQRITADALNTLIVEEIMEWTALGTLGTFKNGCSAGNPIPRMRKLRVMGTEVWEFEGRVVMPSTAPGTSVDTFQFTSGPFVSAERGFCAYGFGSTYAHRVGFTSSGLIRCQTPSGSTSNSTGFMLDGFCITNP